jgi:hypothetical protein
MSIYVVRLSEWFSKNDENYEICKETVKFSRCFTCNKKNIKYKYAMGHHSVPWGNGDVWCNKKCLKSKGKK